MQSTAPNGLAKSRSASATHNTSSDSVTLASLLKAGGDMLRVGILQVLAKDSYGVLELAEAFGMKQSAMSHHLKVLAIAELVCTRKEGNSVFYRRASIGPSDPLAGVKQAIFQRVDQLALSSPVADGLARLWQERAKVSQQFFHENAGKFKAQQDLIASFDSYGKPVAELLALTHFPAKKLALEVGPGAGECLPILANHFEHIVALDNNREMLNQAQAKTSNLNNIHYILGDTATLAELAESTDVDANTPSSQFDCAVINMVLHHTPSPAHVISDVSKQLKPGGALLITDLCSHQQIWAREACGDIWLGFEPHDLTQWAQACNLEPGQSTYLALRNGFQIQIQQFYKQSFSKN